MLHAVGTTFIDNQASGAGGAVAVSGGVSTFTTCTFEHNRAGGAGAALHVNGGDVTLRHSTLLTSSEGDAINLAQGRIEACSRNRIQAQLLLALPQPCDGQLCELSRGELARAYTRR